MFQTIVIGSKYTIIHTGFREHSEQNGIFCGKGRIERTGTIAQETVRRVPWNYAPSNLRLRGRRWARQRELENHGNNEIKLFN